MKQFISTAAILFGVSLFCGIVIIGIGFGAAFPIISRIAAPITCPGRDLQLSTDTSSYAPGETTTLITWTCVDPQTGAKLDVSTSTTLVSGVIYSLLLFLVLMLRIVLNRSGQPVEAGPEPAGSRTPVSTSESQAVEANWNKLEELKRMHDANLISDQEYQQKKIDLLRNL